MNVQDELRSLQEIHDSGGMSTEDFEQAKRRLLERQAQAYVAPTQPTYAPAHYGAMDQPTRQWAMILHLSQFAGFAVPVAGWLAPLLIWQLKKNDLPGIDAHGKIVMNWIISEFIYIVVGVILVFFLIGIPLLLALAAMGLIFPILGGIKANSGETWKYPLSIPFFK